MRADLVDHKTLVSLSFSFSPSTTTWIFLLGNEFFFFFFPPQVVGGLSTFISRYSF